MTIRMELQHYEAKAVCRGTKRYLECMADIGLDEPLALPVLQVDGAEAGPVLLVLAAVHGDEYEGVETVLRLYRSLRPGRLAGSVIMIPAANLRRIRREDAELFYSGAYRLMRHLGMLGEAADETDKTGDQAGAHAEQAVPIQVPAHTGAKQAERRPPTRIYGDGNFDGSETAGADGFFIPAVSLNTIVRAGDKIGAVCRLDGLELQEVRASRGGMVVMLAGSPPVRAGDPLYMLAGTEPPVSPE
ncbi:succinylglutamate desuccinylase/aspartoacylase family protein [Paenibacillus sp. GYB004]|uniref:succinylglutamate desuccinylase/aspartoacylase family protein n=1 Tax=Paenibacillus sp. GYB004 TaxID=2994393 RepID=UPI002F969A9B